MSEDKDIQLVSAKIDLLNERIASLKGADKKDTQPWYAIVTGVLGVPALLIVMVMNWTQYRTNTVGVDKTLADTEKTRLEVAQLRATSEQLKTAVGSQDLESLKRALNEAIPLLQQSAVRLEKRDVPPNTQAELLARYVVIWALGSFLSAVYAVFFLGWDLVTQLPYSLSMWFRRRLRDHQRAREEQLRLETKDLDYDLQRKQTEELYAAYERKQMRLDGWIQWSSTILRLVPRAVQVAIQVSIFTALIVPMFDMAAIQSGSTVRFAHVWASARNLEIKKSLEYVQDVVVPKEVSSRFTAAESFRQ
jgi:hypothetical protein